MNTEDADKLLDSEENVAPGLAARIVHSVLTDSYLAYIDALNDMRQTVNWADARYSEPYGPESHYIPVDHDAGVTLEDSRDILARETTTEADG